MTQVCSVYAQLLQLFPRGQFAQAVKQHQAERNVKGFTCWEQFVGMLFCQMAHCRRKFRFKNKLMSLDGSIIELPAAMFDWAKYRQRQGDWQST